MRSLDKLPASAGRRHVALRAPYEAPRLLTVLRDRAMSVTEAELLRSDPFWTLSEREQLRRERAKVRAYVRALRAAGGAS